MYLELYIKRREARMTQKDVAERLGVFPETYRLKEKGKSAITIEEGKKLAKIFNCSLDELFKEQTESA